MVEPLPMDADEMLLCHRCGRTLSPGEGTLWLVRIEAMADPYPPVLPADENRESLHDEMHRLLDQMREMSERELADQVHRRLTLHLCGACYEQWIENPAG